MGCAHNRMNTRVIAVSSIDKESDVDWLNIEHNSGYHNIVKLDKLVLKLKYPPQIFDKKVRNRIQGSMIGLALGDALGAHVEFRPYQYLREHPVTNLEGGGTWGLQQGQFTDDTSMALCLGASLVVNGRFYPYDQLVRYKWWYRHGYMSSTGVCFDIGAGTRDAITEFEQRQTRVARANNKTVEELDYCTDKQIIRKIDVNCGSADGAGNGSLMRLCPVPLFFYRNPEYAVDYAGRSSLTTHGNVKAADACRYYSALIVAAMQGEDKQQLLSNNFYEKHKQWFGGNELHNEVKMIAEGSYKKEKGYDDGIRGKGYVVQSLEAALWAFWSDENSFEKGALAAVNLGDDTDTTAAIYGQLAGAYYGYDALPDKWKKKIFAETFILCLSDWIAYRGTEWFPQESSYAKIHATISKL